MLRRIVYLGLILIASGIARAEGPQWTAVGGIGSPLDAMIFYVAHGAPDACGPGCADWMAAEGTVQWGHP